MAELLELPHLVQQHGVAEMQVRRGGIEAGLDQQRLAAPQLPDQVGFGEDLLGAASELGELRGGGAGQLRRAVLVGHGRAKNNRSAVSVVPCSRRFAALRRPGN